MTETTDRLVHIARLAAAAWKEYRISGRPEFESFLEMVSAEAVAALALYDAPIEGYRVGAFYKPRHPTPGMGPVEFKGLRDGKVIYRQRGKAHDRACSPTFWPTWVSCEEVEP